MNTLEELSLENEKQQVVIRQEMWEEANEIAETLCHVPPEESKETLKKMVGIFQKTIPPSHHDYRYCTRNEIELGERTHTTLEKPFSELSELLIFHLAKKIHPDTPKKSFETSSQKMDSTTFSNKKMQMNMLSWESENIDNDAFETTAHEPVDWKEIATILATTNPEDIHKVLKIALINIGSRINSTWRVQELLRVRLRILHELLLLFHKEHPDPEKEPKNIVDLERHMKEYGRKVLTIKILSETFSQKIDELTNIF